jgi:hypothetical protein
MKDFEVGVGCGQSTSGCSNSNCESAPDFCIKRGDTKPSFKVSMEDCDGVVDLTDENLLLDANMWFKARLKSSIDSSSSVISFADSVGFDQVSVGDIVLTDRTRNPEKMLVSSIDESAKTVTVQRGYESTSPDDWSKGTLLRIFKFVNEPAEIQSVFEQVENLEGTVAEELSDTFMVFNWNSPHTSMPGCYWLEFKLIMMSESSVLWVKRMPLSKEGFMIRIVDSPSIH